MASEAIDVVLKLVDQFTGSLSKIQTTYGNFEKKINGGFVDSMGKWHSANGKYLTSLKSDLDGIASAFAPASIAAGAALGGAVKLAADYDKALQSAGKALDLNKTELMAFDKNVIAIQKNLGNAFGQTTIANIAATAGKLGIAKNEIGAFTEIYAKLAVATDTKNIEDLVEDGAKIGNIFKLNVEQTRTFAASLNRLDDAFPVTAQNIVNYVKRAGLLAATSKLSAENTAAWGTALMGAGAAPNVAATAMNKFMQTLGAARVATDKQEAGFKKLGFSLDEIAQLYAKDANQALLEVFTRIKNLDSITQKDVIGQLFGQEHVDLGNAVIGQLDNITKAQRLANETTANGTKLNAEFERQQKSLSGQIEAAKNVSMSLGIALGQALLPGIVSVLGGLTPFVNKLVELTQQQPMISTLIASALGIVAIIAPLAAITSSIITLMPVIAGIGTAITTVLGLIVSAPALTIAAVAAIGAAVGALGYLIYSNWDKIVKTVGNGWNSMINGGKQFFSWLTNGFNSNINAVVNWGNKIINLMVNTFNEALKPVTQFINNVGANFNGLINSAVNWGASIIQGFIRGFESMYQNAQTALNNFTNWIRQYLPSSDAKRGGLSDLTYSGKMFADTFLSGIEAGGLNSALDNLSTPRINNSGLTPAYATSGTQQTININYTISGGSSNDDLMKKLKQRDKELLDLINRSGGRINRTAY
jgi:TP901 family phage tail tape measure protein